MGKRYVATLAGRARPITTERDYWAVMLLLQERCRPIWRAWEDERLEALFREITDYEDRCANGDGAHSLRLNPVSNSCADMQLGRRWSDWPS